MYTTQLDNGVLNAYAVEPEMYLAAYPSPEQQQRYALQGAIATLLVTGLFLVSLAVS
ncbi:MAG: ssl1498 family light-harvesting-like protein [Leptolyngbya sp. SIOISBB]|nr:ssl1498 family light-harvesting-like protein [Leptolyngbya sp. SIOISBB]